MSLRRDTFWAGLDTLASQGLAFLFRLALARVLSPAEFGLIAMALTTVALLQVINDFGLTAALIQKDAGSVDESLVRSTFSTSLVISLALFGFNLAIVAPLTAAYYTAPELAGVVGALGFSFLLTPVTSVSQALLLRQKNFKAFALTRAAATVTGVSAGLALLIAYRSVWALVAQVLVTQAIMSIGLLAQSGWRPRLEIDWARMREVFGYSGLVFLTDAAVVLARNFDVILIGRVLTQGDVGLYALAFYLTDTVRLNLMSVLNRVMFVHYSSNKNDLTIVRAQYLKTLRVNCAVIFPIMLAMIVLGPWLSIRLIGPEWSGMGPTLQVLSFAAMIHAAGGTSSTVFKALGRPGLDLNLFLATTLLVLAPSLLVGVATGGLLGAAFAVAFTKLVSTLVRQYYLDKLIGSTAKGVALNVVAMLALSMPAAVAALVVRAALVEWF